MSAMLRNGAIAQRLNAERIALVGWTRAVLMQLAHPLIAAAVAEHSSFGRSAMEPMRRLQQTLEAMLALVFGDASRRDDALARINALHRTIYGRLDEDIGPYKRGTHYSAEDPALLLWVHATLLESVPLAYAHFVNPVSEAECDRYCEETAWVARSLGVTDRAVPRNTADLRQYLDDMYASGAIAVSDTARELARRVLAPPLAWTAWPVARVNRLFAVGRLPPQLRADYGFPWKLRDELELRRWAELLRGMRRLAPEALATWSDARMPRRVAN